AVYVPYSWKCTSPAVPTLTAKIRTGGVDKATLTLDRNSTALSNWSQVVGFSDLKYLSGDPTYNFTIIAAVANAAGSIRPYTYYAVRGKTDFTLTGYNPAASATLPICKPNAL